jgi:uncharacterized membrane protein
MEILYKIFLFLHILGGFTSLVIMLVPMLSKKGGKIHKLTGEIFFWSMMLTTNAALLISIYNSNYFLFFISVFSFYLTYAGKRIIRIIKNHFISLADKIIFFISSVICIVMLVYAFNCFDFILIIFGLIFLLLLKDSFLFFRYMEKQKKQKYILLHLRFIIAACIATVTAFLVVNFKIQQGWLLWLSPTFAGTIFIIYLSKKCGQSKFPIKKS